MAKLNLILLSVIFICISRNTMADQAVSKCNLPGLHSSIEIPTPQPSSRENDRSWQWDSFHFGLGNVKNDETTSPISNKYRSDKKEYRFNFLDRMFNRRALMDPASTDLLILGYSVTLMDRRPWNVSDSIIISKMRK
jgi:hypothetical protein